MSESNERNEVIRMLTEFENQHVWPTTWIINGLKEQWGMMVD
jgi:hypothetical protein